MFLLHSDLEAMPELRPLGPVQFSSIGLFYRRDLLHPYREISARQTAELVGICCIVLVGRWAILLLSGGRGVGALLFPSLLLVLFESFAEGYITTIFTRPLSWRLPIRDEESLLSYAKKGQIRLLFEEKSILFDELLGQDSDVTSGHISSRFRREIPRSVAKYVPYHQTFQLLADKKEKNIYVGDEYDRTAFEAKVCDVVVIPLHRYATKYIGAYTRVNTDANIHYSVPRQAVIDEDLRRLRNRFHARKCASDSGPKAALLLGQIDRLFYIFAALQTLSLSVLALEGVGACVPPWLDYCVRRLQVSS